MEIESLNEFNRMKFIDYTNFGEIEEIGSGGYGTENARQVYLLKKTTRSTKTVSSEHFFRHIVKLIISRLVFIFTSNFN